MKFLIEKKFRKYTIWEKIRPNLIGFVIAISIPIIYSFIFFHSIYKKLDKDEEISEEPNVWTVISETTKSKIWTKFVDFEKTWNEIYESDEYEFEKIEDFDDVGWKLYYIKSEPSNQELNRMLFYGDYFKAYNGIFLVRINKKTENMSLYFLHNDLIQFNFLCELKPLQWNFEMIDNILILKGYSHKGIYIVELKNRL